MPIEQGHPHSRRTGGRARAGAPPTRGFTFDGEASLAAPRELIHGVVGFDGVAFLGGQSGAGKTFVAIDAAIALAAGDAPFFGHAVRERVGVVILAAEGSGTMAHRIEAARRARNAPEALPIAWAGDVPNQGDPNNVAEMVERLRAVGARFHDEYGVRLGVVIVDTVAAAFHLKDENDNAEGARVVNHLRQMGDALGCLMVPVHHYGKSAETGLRGASAFRAGADVVISVLADRNESTGEVTRRRLALAKSRTRDEGADR
jgi:RecA-family ATPase